MFGRERQVARRSGHHRLFLKVAIAGAVALLAYAAGALGVTTGSLTPKSCIADDDDNPDFCPKTANGLGGANAVVVSRDGKSVYATSTQPASFSSSADDAIQRFTRDTTSGKLTPKSCIGRNSTGTDCAVVTIGLSNPAAVTISSDGKSVYVAGSGDNAIVRFKRDTTSGKLTSKGCIADADPGHNPDNCTKTAPGLYSPSSIVVSRDGKSVYVAGSGDNAIVRFKRDTSTGALTNKGCVGDTDDNTDSCAKVADGLDGPAALAISSDGKSLYAAAPSANAVVRFNRNTTTGALTDRGCVAAPSPYNPDGCAQTQEGLNYAGSLAISPDGKSLYAGSSLQTSQSAIVRLNRDVTNGALTPKSCRADPANNTYGCAFTSKGLDGASSLVVSPDGKSLYVGGRDDAAIVRFDRATTGVLTGRGCISDTDNNPDGCAKVSKALDGVRGLAVSSDGKSLYAAGYDDSAVVRFNRQP
jgi:sugar lactone lactonase YvrE